MAEVKVTADDLFTATSPVLALMDRGSTRKYVELVNSYAATLSAWEDNDLTGVLAANPVKSTYNPSGHWAKVVKSVDQAATNGYAFQGVPINFKFDLAKRVSDGDVIVVKNRAHPEFAVYVWDTTAGMTADFHDAKMPNVSNLTVCPNIEAAKKIVTELIHK